MFLDAAITNEFYKDGFFGYGEKGDFKMFSLSYFIPIILMVVLVVLLYKYRNFFQAHVRTVEEH